MAGGKSERFWPLSISRQLLALVGDKPPIAQAVVVGSAIANKFHNSPRTPEGRADAAAFVAEMVRAVKAV